MQKLPLLLAFLSILVCYLSWGGGNSAFLYEVEYLILFQKKGNASTLAHPAVFAPMLGQILLLVAVFQRNPARWMVFTGLTLMGLLAGLILLIGVLSGSLKIFLSTLPFFLSAGWCLRRFRR